VTRRRCAGTPDPRGGARATRSPIRGAFPGSRPIGRTLVGWPLVGWALIAAGGCGGGRPAVSTAAQEERIAVRVADEVLERMDREGLLEAGCECADVAERGGD
jgi:hypothetical protein